MAVKKRLPLRMFAELDREARRLQQEAPNSFAVAGGFALQLYGGRRLTVDLDVVAPKEVLPSSLGLRQEGVISFGGQYLVSPRGLPVDWIVRKDSAADLYLEAYEAAGVQQVCTRPYRIVPIEYLAVMKLAAKRAKDWNDLMGILGGASDEQIKKMRDITKRHFGDYAVEDLDAEVAEARWRASRGEETIP